MMRTVDTIRIAAPPDRVFAAAREVERWPDLLAHYRWVRLLEGTTTHGVVEMAAWRPFGPVRWPTWWKSRMESDPERRVVRYRHIGGITTGMDVEWAITPDADRAGGSLVTLLHWWEGPSWPLIRRPAAEWVIGPVFVHGIASRTLSGLRAHLENPS